MVDSVDDLKSLLSVSGFQMPNFEVFVRCEDCFSTEQNHP